jgi:hypothetical protein
VMLAPSFELEGCVHDAKVSKERPEHSDQSANSQN